MLGGGPQFDAIYRELLANKLPLIVPPAAAASSSVPLQTNLGSALAPPRHDQVLTVPVVPRSLPLGAAAGSNVAGGQAQNQLRRLQDLAAKMAGLLDAFGQVSLVSIEGRCATANRAGCLLRIQRLIFSCLVSCSSLWLCIVKSLLPASQIFPTATSMVSMCPSR